MTFTNTQTKLGQAITTNASGDYAVRTIIEGDQTLGNLTLTGDLNGGGGHILNDQTTTNMMSKGTVYRFDGVDYIEIADNIDATLPDNALGMQAKFTTTSIAASQMIFNKDDGSDREYGVRLFADGSIIVFLFSNASDYSTFTSPLGVIATDVEMDLFFTYNGTGVIYINGLPITTTNGDVGGGFTGFTNSTIPLRIGANNTGANPLIGEMGFACLYNFAPTASEVKDLVSGNIPFKWQYGSQTSVVVNGDFATDTVWIKNADWTIAAGVAHCDGTLNTRIRQENIINSGKEYAYSFDWARTSGTSVTLAYFDGSAYVDIVTVADTGTGTATGTFTTGASNGAIFFKSDGAWVGDIDNVSVNSLGAVALYDQTSISETTWYDKANGNDGAVTGASVLNAQETLYVTGSGKVEGLFGMGDYTLLTIASGVITATSSLHYIETESAGATDDLDTINGGEEGNLLIIAPGSSARTVVAKDGTGNLVLAGDFTMDDATDMLLLIKIGANWRELSRSAN